VENKKQPYTFPWHVIILTQLLDRIKLGYHKLEKETSRLRETTPDGTARLQLLQVIMPHCAINKQKKMLITAFHLLYRISLHGAQKLLHALALTLVIAYY